MEDPIIAQKKPAVAVDVVLLTFRGPQLHVGLISRSATSHGGTLGLPGSFVKYDEPIETTARRAIAKGGINTPVEIEQLATFGQDLNRDFRIRTISIVYFALISAPPSNTLRWEPIDALPDLVFDHAAIVAYTVQRLRAELYTTDRIFRLMPDEFTLTDLQQAAEGILGTRLDKRNFRKKILATFTLRDTRRSRMDGAHRPARIYTRELTP